MQDNIAGRQLISQGWCVGQPGVLMQGALCSLLLSVGCQVIPRVFRCWAVVLELFSFFFAFGRFSLPFTMPTTRSANNSLHTALVLLLCSDIPPAWKLAIRKPLRRPIQMLESRQLWLPLLPGLCKLLWLLNERTLRHHRSPSCRPAPRWFLALQILPFHTLCL